MSSSSVIDFQISNVTNLEKIERFMNANAYRENIQYSSNFNTRLCHERQLRLPFFDPQTNVAQNHCSLYMTKRQRMPGIEKGQIYSYPGNDSNVAQQSSLFSAICFIWFSDVCHSVRLFFSAARWRKHRRQYLTKMLRPFSSIGSSITTASHHANGIAQTLHHHLQRRLDYGLNEIEADLNGSALFDENSSLAGTGDGKYWFASGIFSSSLQVI